MLDQMLASTRPSQSYHHAKFDCSMLDSFDSVDVAFSHLPRSSSVVSIITSSTSSFHLTFFDSGGTAPLPFVELTSFQLFRLVRLLLPHLLSHSILASEVSTYWVKETRVPGFFPWGSYLSILRQGPGNWRDEGCGQDLSNSQRCDDGDEEGVM